VDSLYFARANAEIQVRRSKQFETMYSTRAKPNAFSQSFKRLILRVLFQLRENVLWVDCIFFVIIIVGFIFVHIKRSKSVVKQ